MKSFAMVALLGWTFTPSSKTSHPHRVDLSAWVGLWTPYDRGRAIQLSLMADGHFDYGFFPTMQSASNSSIEISGDWKFKSGRIYLNERKVAYVPNRYMPYPRAAQVRTLNTTVDVVVKRGGQVLIAQFPLNPRVWYSLVRRSKTPKPFN